MQESLQYLSIDYRWMIMKEENDIIKEAKKNGQTYEPPTFENGDTLKHLLVRSRFLLFEAPDKWSKKQKERAQILFEQFDDINNSII